VSLATLGIAAALLSALLQAVAHALLKSGEDKLAVRGAIGLTSAVLLLPVVAFVVAPPSPALVSWLMLSNVVHAIYQLVLIEAYENEDFVVAYPVARGVAPIATLILGIVLLGDEVGALTFVGAACVTVGVLTMATTGNPRRRGMIAAVAAGLLTTTYTLIDAHAVRLAAETWTFIAWFFIGDGIVMMAILIAMRRSRTVALLRQEGWRGVAAGVASVATYSAALVALSAIAAGAASALRETSVIFGLVIGGRWLKERLGPVRSACAVLVTIGAVLIAVGL